jgi:phosphohistidine phosphatase
LQPEPDFILANMELILWRHADAEDGVPDMARKLTKKGRKQAERVAEWLAERLPKEYVLISSPAVRARETAEALGKAKIVEALAPGASVKEILQTAGWPGGEATVVLVGHQPDFGRAIAYLVSRRETDWSLKKGGLWWLVPDEVRAVISPDLL